MVSEFDKVKLKSGVIGYISDKLDDTHFYADISKSTGEISTVFITIDDILSVFEETERPIKEVLAAESGQSRQAIA